MIKKVIIILLTFFFVTFSSYSDGDENSSLNIGNIIHWLEYYQIKHIDIVIKQVIIETNYLTSEVCLYNNNLFGMRLPSKRETTATGKKHGYAIYENWIDSIKDFKLWQDNWKVTENTDYIKLLKRVGYAQDPSYIDKLKNIKIIN